MLIISIHGEVEGGFNLGTYILRGKVKDGQGFYLRTYYDHTESKVPPIQRGGAYPSKGIFNFWCNSGVTIEQ